MYSQYSLDGISDLGMGKSISLHCPLASFFLVTMKRGTLEGATPPAPECDTGMIFGGD